MGRVRGRGGSSDHRALGEAVRELRRRRGLRQKAVAFDAGVGDQYVSQLERGEINPSFGAVLAIVRTMGFTLGELVELYERRLAEIDPDAGSGVRLCPSTEALAHLDGLNARQLATHRRAVAKVARSVDPSV